MSLIGRLIVAFCLMAGVAPALGQVPPPVPALPDTERRTTYAISASLCSCAVGFQIFGDSTDYANWLEVFVNGIAVPQAGNWTIASPTGSLSTIPRPITDAVLTFTAAQTGTVQIVGARRPRRASQFQVQPSARDFNQVISDLTAMLRENWDKTNDVTGRAVLAPPGETLALLPVLNSRKSLGACYDSSGNLTACVSIPSSTFSAGSGIALTGSGPTAISADIAAGSGVALTGSHPVSIATTFTQTGTGAVARTVSAELALTVRPEQFGAACNGTGDDGPAIQRAIDSTGSSGASVRLSACTYRVVTPIVIAKNNVTIKGAGRSYSGSASGNLTTLDFEPTVDGTAIWCNGTAVELVNCNLSDFAIVSSDITHKKTAIKLTDVSESSFYNIIITGIGSTFTGGAGGSTGLETYGRDLTTFQKLDIFADLPISIGPNPKFVAAGEAADHWMFRDIYLVTNGSPCITVQNGTILTNTTFDGLSAAKCFYGFYWINSTAPTGGQPGLNLSIRNFRFEQSTSATAYSIHVQQTNGNSLIGLNVTNGAVDSFANGLFLSGVFAATITGVYEQCAVGSTIALNMDSTNDQISLINNKWNPTCTITTGLTAMSAAGTAASTSTTVPNSAVYYNPTSAAAVGWFFRTVATTPLTVAALPICNAASKGARAFVTDANAAFTAGIGAVVAGGGANNVPVTCDGTNWRIG